MNYESQGARKVESILKREKIKYIKEKPQSDYRNGLLRFDFFLPELNIGIEFSGRQHYEYVPFFFKTQKEFKTAQTNDSFKIKYCLIHKIQLYIIPFWEEANLNCFSDLINPAFRATNEFHYFNSWRVHQNLR